MTPELASIFEDSEVTELLVNGPHHTWVERQGRLLPCPLNWVGEVEYRQFLRAVLDLLNTDLSLQEPYCSGRLGDLRVQVVGPPMSALPIASFRRLKPQGLNLEKWGVQEQESKVEILRKLVTEKQNIIIYGSTGSGKTTLLSSLLLEVAENQRVLLLEDIEELVLPNTSSLRLLTRPKTHDVLAEITLSDLVKHSLRLRPDRLALGEVRGPEAKDLLMALATGHRGSFGTLHAQSLNEALLRLEMLVQLGAPQWQSKSIRQLILLSVQALVGVKKSESGERVIAEIHSLSGLEDFGFLTDRLA